MEAVQCVEAFSVSDYCSRTALCGSVCTMNLHGHKHLLYKLIKGQNWLYSLKKMLKLRRISTYAEILNLFAFRRFMGKSQIWRGAFWDFLNEPLYSR